MHTTAARLKLWSAYFALLAAGVTLFLLIRGHGETLTAPPPESEPAGPGLKADGGMLYHVLLALAAVVVVGQVLGRLFRLIHQPPVVGEVIAGILLGPSLLGRVAPDVFAYLLPPAAAPLLGIIAQFGVILFMFLVGLELKTSLLSDRAHATLIISHSSIIVPFVLGGSLALWLYPRLSHSGVPFTSFALFLGVALAITAFPVLARILTDRGLTKTELGGIALSVAATGDATAWCLLAVVVGVAQAEVAAAAWVAVLTVAFIAVMLLAGRPLATALARRHSDDNLPRGAFVVVFLALLLASLIAELIGIHALFRAFLLGAVIPHDSAIARALTSKLEELVTILLLPAFFAFTGMRTEIGLLDTPEHWLICGLIILVASVGKIGGTLGAARLTGLDWRTSAALGVLMNTRGLMELIVLNVGLDLGVISPTLYAMMVIMALATTIATTPVLHWLQPATPQVAGN